MVVALRVSLCACVWPFAHVGLFGGQCAQLEAVHGPSMVHGWLLATSSVAPNRTAQQVCSEALECKLLLQPLMTADNQFRRACPKDCSGNGVCNNGVCACSAGFSGDDCSVERCPGNCNNQGLCRFGKCFCAPGFLGDSCEKQLDCFRAPDGKVCGGHGLCMYGKCFCDPGFTNENCTQGRESARSGVCAVCTSNLGACARAVSRCPKDCSNVGFCLHGQCFCPPGLGGPDCSVKLSAGKCPNFCSGHGRCRHGQCLCDAGHYGRDCSQVRECPIGDNGLQCSGHGSCHNGRCQCDEGFAGFHCALQTTCAGNGTCSGRGVCWLGTCYCHPGYRGAACEKDQPCLNGCSGKGVCCGGRCKCLAGYFGRDCSEGTGPKLVLDGQVQPAACPANGSAAGMRFDEATVRALQQTGAPCPNACSGLGVCLNGTCACLPGVDGVDCANVMQRIPCPNKCSNRGVCVFGKCHCMPPYNGVDCSESADRRAALLKLNECPNKCNGRGVCRTDENGAHCACDPGYAGAGCEVEVPCKHNCHGRGLCDRGKCFCFPGFSGAFCEAAAKCPGGCSNHGQCFYGERCCHARAAVCGRATCSVCARRQVLLRPVLLWRGLLEDPDVPERLQPHARHVPWQRRVRVRARLHRRELHGEAAVPERLQRAVARPLRGDGERGEVRVQEGVDRRRLLQVGRQVPERLLGLRCLPLGQVPVRGRAHGRGLQHPHRQRQPGVHRRRPAAAGAVARAGCRAPFR